MATPVSKHMATKRLLRRVVLFWGILSAMVVLYLAFLSLRPSADGFARIRTWTDANANAIWDEGEQPLPGVCVWFRWAPDPQQQYTLHTEGPDQCDEANRTDASGTWVEGWLPGSSCSDLYEFAEPPPGFIPTTTLGSNGCTATFGFAPTGTPIQASPLTAEEFSTRARLNQWIPRVLGAAAFLAFSAYVARKLE